MSEKLNPDSKELKSLSDDEVFALSLANPEIFSEIFHRYEAAFMRKALEILRNPEDAHDVVADTFVRIYLSAKKYKKQEGASFKSWAYKILLNQCFTLYRKKKREWEFTAPLDPEFVENIGDASQIESFEAKISKEYLISVISKIPAKLANVTQLYFLEGLSQKVIAKKEGISNEVVRTRIFRAKAELKKYISLKDKTKL
jgi:RNA polymerase sigma-70 factor (ECF subfamily)